MVSWKYHCPAHERINVPSELCKECKHQWKNHNRFGCKLFNCLCTEKNYPIRMIARRAIDDSYRLTKMIKDD